MSERNQFTSYRDGSKKSLHQRECLGRSSEVIGQLYPVLKDASGKVIDGFHRLDVDPDWKSVTLENVKTEEDRLIVSLHANLGRRKVPMTEKIEYVNALAQIYWDQGLRPKANKMIIDRSGNNKGIIINEIFQKLQVDLRGVMAKSTIGKLLLPKYKNDVHAEAKKKQAKKRQDNTSAYKLIYDCFGKHIERSFGEGIFGRLEREMFDKAKNSLMNDPWWINKVKDELRVEIRAEVEAEIKAHVLAEYGIDDPVTHGVEAVLNV